MSRARRPALVLASASPRRKAYFAAYFPRASVVPSAAETPPKPGERPLSFVRRAARDKALDVAKKVPAEATVVGADTIVVLDGEILGKPRDGADAVRMLRALSGRTHRVVTALYLARGARRRQVAVTTSVSFRRLEEGEIASYVATGDAAGKAGAYGIQGLAAGFVQAIRGSYTNVVGLPLAELFRELRVLGFEPVYSPKGRNSRAGS